MSTVILFSSTRRRRARERQQKLMANFAKKQEEFMSRNPDAANERTCSPDGSDRPMTSDAGSECDVAGVSMATARSYDCVICGVCTPSTEENPMGLVGLLQATSGKSELVP